MRHDRRSPAPRAPQDWALLDVSHLAEERGGGVGRRRQVFCPEPGCAGWRELGGFCIVQLADLTAALKQALPSAAGGAGAALSDCCCRCRCCCCCCC
jgi:hypothetical protein